MKSAVYSPSKSLNQLASYDSSGDSSEDEGSSRPAGGVRSVIFKRDQTPPQDDAEMPSLEDDDEVTSQPKSPKRKKGKSTKEERDERLQHLKKKYTEKKEKEKKGKAMYVPPHRRNKGSSDEHSSSEDSESAEDSGKKGKSTKRQRE